MSNTFDKLAVLDSFIEEVNSYLPEIEANLERLAQSPDDMEAIEESYRRTHTIGGSASMMDFPGLAHVAHGMEDFLSDAYEGGSALDAPTIELLQHSLDRLHRLLQGVRGGIDENAIIAEDDADYVRYRTIMDGLAQDQTLPASMPQEPSQEMLPQAETAHEFAMPVSASTHDSTQPTPSMPSLDDVLASFRTPTVAEGEDIEWPEETVLSPTPAAFSANQQTVMETVQTPEPSLSGPDAWELLASPLPEPATNQPTQPISSVAPVPITPMPQQNQQNQMPVSIEHEQPQPVVASLQPDENQQNRSLPAIASPREVVSPAASDTFTRVYSDMGDMQEETHALETQVSSLQEMLTQLRPAMMVIEAQRTEFKGFLDGSKDALDRMEEWAGRAMGLNLKNSPEQVRRYLPLSVMWVANTKLKKVLDVLHPITNGMEMTDEQIQTSLKQLYTSIASCGEAFEQMQAESASSAFTRDPGWTPWEMQVSQQPEDMRERVTFERRGDPALMRAEIEAALRAEFRREEETLRERLRREETRLRDEIRREYEARPITLAARNELEQQIRNEVRRDFENSRRLQESVGGAETTLSVQELEAQLRREIEIQVREEFFTQISAAGFDPNSSAPSLVPPVPAAPRTSNFADQARQAAGLSALDVPALSPPSTTTTGPKTYSAPAPTASQPPSVQSMPVAPVAPSARSIMPAAFSGDFGEEAAEIFRLEAEEHLQTISVHVAALEKDPTNRDLIQGIRRATHTLKGAAGMMGFRLIADLSHVSEDLLDSVMEGNTPITPAVLGLMLDTSEILEQLINGLDTPSADDEAKVQALRIRYVTLLGEENTSASTSGNEDVDIYADDEYLDDSAAGTNERQAVETNVQRAARGDLSVRVRLQKLDELVNLFGELLVNRSVLEERIQRLVSLVGDVGISSVRLNDVGQKLESRFEAATLPSGRSVQVMPGQGNRNVSFRNGSTNRAEPTHMADFDELELDRYTEFHQLARGLSESVSDMATLSTEMESIIRECEGVFSRENRLSTTFQDRLMKARLVPLSSMTPRLYRAARSVALKQQKEFDFLLEGEETEVDRTVYEEIAGPLLHLMRNAVNHALETPEVRVQQGKQPVGQIKLSARYEGNQVVITVRDDGTGIDPEHVRRIAIERGVIRPNQTLNDNDVIDLIFRPGFSTAEFLSEESGRGVGLDVVRDSVSRLRGTLEVESMPGQGTAFTMKFPTSLAIQGAMIVEVSEQQFAIPTVMVESIGRLDNFKERVMAGGRPALKVRNEVYPLIILAGLLSLPVHMMDERAPLLLINAGGQHVALVIDNIKGKLDVVTKNLGPHLRHVHGIAGGTIMGNGRVILILELNELLSTRSRAMMSIFNSSPSIPPAPLSIAAPHADRTAAVSQSQYPPSQSGNAVPVNAEPVSMVKPPAPVQPKQPEHGKHVLVVDDSPSVRRVVSNMLKQHGWEVQMARDGVEALEMITRETPAAVLLDIEMPRMDGYELIATVRAQEQYRTLPMVILTSRAASKHQQRALQLGASGYVVKPYQDEELINMLNSLVYGAAIR